MADSAQVRLVRCPKCENLLPELADYSVYQCGGCGTVLRAKNKHQEEETLSSKSDEERAEGASVKLGNSIEKDTVDFSNPSDMELKSIAVSKVLDAICSGTNDLEIIEKSENRSSVATDKRVDENNLNVNSEVDDFSNPISQIDSANPTRLSTTEGAYRLEKNPGNSSKGVRFSPSNYSNVGPSNGSDSVSGFEDLQRAHIEENRANKVKYLEQDRAELLRKLDELNDQFSQPSNLVDKTKDKIPMVDVINPINPYDGYGNWRREGTSGSNRVSRQFSMPDKHSARPPLSSYRSDFSPYSKGHDMAGLEYYSSMHNPNNISGFEDSYAREINGRGLYQFPSSYRGRSHPFHSRQFSEANLDSLDHFHHNAILHQPSCTCYGCFENYQKVSPVAPFGYYNRRVRNVPFDNLPYHPENNSRIAAPPMNFFHDQQSRSRWSSDLRSEIGSFSSTRPRRMLFGGRGRRFRPVSGGAPFLSCYNCFELLVLPKKVRKMLKNEHTICCGACSSIIKYGFVNNKLILSEQRETRQIPLDVDDSSGNTGRENAAPSLGPVKLSSDNFSSDDYDNSGYDFQAVDQEPVLQSTVPNLSSSKQHVMHSLHSSSPSMSEEEDNSPEVLITPMEIAKNVDQPMNVTPSVPLAGSPLQSHFEYSSNNHVVNKFSNGDQSSRSDQEKAKPNKVTSRQNSLKDASPVTEMEIPMNEYSNTVVSQECNDAYRESDQSRTNKGGDSFFANIIKKSFKSTRADGKSSVSINGRIIPDRIVKKAEKMAGRIQPGEYWYDYRAGFWGVMGGPCLGIIPPFIEELNYAMPENCANGKTGIFVNGRELHRKDLDLLASRGLPTSRDRSYIIEISGRLLDEDTGEEMDGLGKLAPTIEKVKHGFGMRVPRAASESKV